MMRELLQRRADYTRQDSPAKKLRRKRFLLFKSLLETLSRPVRILDLGGTAEYWDQMDFRDLDDVQITIFNLQRVDVKRDHFVAVTGDAKDLTAYRDKEFDIVFSNSVIEHVGAFEDQMRMAKEILRVGKYHYVQTPNYFFPLEPHFLFPFFQMLPLSVRMLLVRHFRLGWFAKQADAQAARDLIASVHLLKRKEIRKMFPDSLLVRERLWGLTKSFMIISKHESTSRPMS